MSAVTLLGTAPSLPELHDLIGRYFGTRTERYSFRDCGEIVGERGVLTGLRWRQVGKRYRFEAVK